MTLRYDLVVLGAGPAGIAAALAARRHDLKVAILDQARAAGGQIYRAPSFPLEADQQASPDLAHGENLRARLAQSGADCFFGHRVWFVGSGIGVAAVAAHGLARFESSALVVATGATERVIPMPGVTLPGVMGLAAATILLKAHAAAPAGPAVVAGVGPLLYAVAAGFLKAGTKITAVVDLARPGEWARAVPGLISRPDLLVRGLGWMARLHRAGVSIHFGHAITAIGGTEQCEDVEIKSVDRDWSVRAEAPAMLLQADSVAIGHGLVPATEALRLLGVPHSFRPEHGGWIPDRNEDRSTAVTGVYVAGDCSGIAGAAAAGIGGSIAGLTVVRDAGRLRADAYAEQLRRLSPKFARANRFGATISQLMTLRSGLVGSMPGPTVVCRCEDVTRSMIDAAAAGGARHVNQLKSTTRCGMGPCQGRMCGEASAELLALASGRDRIATGQWTARAPLLPIPMAAMTGSYSYHDIPKPAPAPA